MPELPEVESLRRGLENTIVGQRIRSVQVKKPKLVSGKGNIRIPSRTKAAEFARGLTGERFAAIERRAKNLLFRFVSGKILLVHLKMSGQFIYKPASAPPSPGYGGHGKAMAGKEKGMVIGGHPIELSEHQLPNKHTHIIFELDPVKDVKSQATTSHGAGGTLYYNDTRMFGYLLYYPSAAAFEAENHFGMLGMEPLDPGFTVAYLRDALAAKKGKIKAVLMDQKVVTGLGNIYADESLFAARIRPDRSAALLTRPEIKKLHVAIQDIIHRAIGVGGSSVATYRLLDETRGNFAREHNVYGKAGIPCARCGARLLKSVIQSRTTVFCPQCQK